MGGLHRQAEYGDVIEVIADFTHHLANPRVAVVPVLAQELAKITQHGGSILIHGFAPCLPRHESTGMQPRMSTGMPGSFRRSAICC